MVYLADDDGIKRRLAKGLEIAAEVIGSGAGSKRYARGDGGGSSL
jgi:hypothetical protein